jgi:phosphohistidine phosphatase
MHHSPAPYHFVVRMRLLLLRHAKSDWTITGEDDHARKLAPRGQKAAAAMARYFRASGHDPDIVLCSTAARTRETLTLIRPAFKKNPRIRFSRSLYLADWQELLAAIRKMSPKSGTTLLVGHNPGIEDLALALAAPPRTETERRYAQLLRKKFPTGALAILDFDGVSSAGILPKRGRLSGFIRPRDLASAVSEET